MYVTIETNLTAQEVAALIGNKGRVIMPPPTTTSTELPAGYEIRQIKNWDGKRAPNPAPHETLWVIVPTGFPQIWGVYFGAKISYIFNVGGTKVWRDDLCIPRTVAASQDKAAEDLVPELLDPEGGYNFSY